MTTLVEWLRDALDTHERIARGASSDPDGSTPSGEHWRWECTSCDTPIPITPVTLLDEILECPSCTSFGVALRSVEQYPTSSAYTLSHFAVGGTEEQRPVDALHLQRNDPAHVLRTVQAHREILDRHQPDAIGCRWCWERDWPCADVHSLAAIYRDHPGFDPSWIGES